MASTLTNSILVLLNVFEFMLKSKLVGVVGEGRSLLESDGALTVPDFDSDCVDRFVWTLGPALW